MGQEGAAASPTGAEGEEGHCRGKLAHFPFLQAFLLKTQAIHFRGLHCLSRDWSKQNIPTDGSLHPCKASASNLPTKSPCLCCSLCTPLLFLLSADKHLFTKRLTVSSSEGLAQVPVSAYCLASVVWISTAPLTRMSGRWMLPRDQSAVLHFTVHICCSE